MKFKAPLSWIAVLFLSVSGFAAPVITSFSPTFGAPGEGYIEIKGSGFVTGAIVKYGGQNGIRDFGAYVSDANTILSIVPTGAQSGPIYVSVEGHGVESAQNFTVIGTGPYIDSFSPSGGDAGTSVTIFGSHFTSGMTVKFNGKTATLTGIGQAQLTVTVPNGATTGRITIQKSGATTAVSSTYFYVNSVIKSFSPFNGRAGTNVVIKGTNFTDATAVSFNGIFSSNLVNVVSNQLTVAVPEGATTGRIYIYTPAPNPGFSTSNFVVQPLITGFTPNKGRPGTNVTIFGENLLGATNVLFGSIRAGQPTAISYGQLTTKVPAGATNCFLTVLTTNGSFTSSERFYLPPVITSFSPTFGPEGSTVTIVGTNFLDASAVTFNGQPATEFTVTNNGVIGAVIPGVITGPISVTTPYGTVTTDDDHLFYGTPIITGFTPLHGMPGTNVTIFGTNFLGITAVQFNGSNASFTLNTNGVLTAIVPTNATSGPISVTTLAGTTTSALPFTLDYSSDLAVLIAAPESVLLGNDFTYVITITNAGPFAAPTVMLTNWLPGQATLKSASKTQGTLITSGNPVIGDLGAIPAFGKATVTLTVTPHEATTLSDSASVTGGFPDPNPADNLASISTTIYVVPTLNLQVTGSQVRLSWSVNLSDFVLQSTDNLASSNSWQNVSTEPQFEGDQKVVTETLGAGPRFYRLKH